MLSGWLAGRRTALLANRGSSVTRFPRLEAVHNELYGCAHWPPADRWEAARDVDHVISESQGGRLGRREMGVGDNNRDDDNDDCNDDDNNDNDDDNDNNDEDNNNDDMENNNEESDDDDNDDKNDHDDDGNDGEKITTMKTMSDNDDRR